MEKPMGKKAKGASGKEKTNMDSKLLHGNYVDIGFVVKERTWR